MKANILLVVALSALGTLAAAVPTQPQNSLDTTLMQPRQIRPPATNAAKDAAVAQKAAAKNKALNAAAAKTAAAQKAKNKAIATKATKGAAAQKGKVKAGVAKRKAINQALAAKADKLPAIKKAAAA
ncbi:hypothetical protein DFS34DRAFT_592192 [Phlyctochytrium arcticum]|nr:hypothetical protein DFS34DRAFT_592192 [Phlyctochytrium arcticum]